MLDLPWQGVRLEAGAVVSAHVPGWYGARDLAATVFARFGPERVSAVVRSAQGSQWAATVLPGGLELAPYLLTWGRFRAIPRELAAFTIQPLEPRDRLY